MATATVPQGGRAKALRPIPRLDRLAALDAGLAAWARGDWFEAHEVLEPAWMGTADAVERDLYQGLIKLAAAYVHRERDNAVGMRKNLLGARERLARVLVRQPAVEGVDVVALIAAVDARLPSMGLPNLAADPPRIVRMRP